VGMEFHVLQSIHMLVDNKEQIECIVDQGSQIIAISEEVCHRLGLTYDPTIQLHMQSVNGAVDLSLGLSRNVACRIGPVTLYLQIHVIRSPTYHILLGGPFDVLTESIVKHFANADQTITIRDPNTGKVTTIPTISRGSSERRVIGMALAKL
jgi:Aspartyl protease